MRDSDVVAGRGGEEFVGITPGADAAAAIRLAERLLHQVRGTTAPHVGRVTISIGVATLRGGDDLPSLFKRADEALYRAKSTGRDRAVSTEPSITH